MRGCRPSVWSTITSRPALNGEPLANQQNSIPKLKIISAGVKALYETGRTKDAAIFRRPARWSEVHVRHVSNGRGRNQIVCLPVRPATNSSRRSCCPRWHVPGINRQWLAHSGRCNAPPGHRWPSFCQQHGGLKLRSFLAQTNPPRRHPPNQKCDSRNRPIIVKFETRHRNRQEHNVESAGRDCLHTHGKNYGIETRFGEVLISSRVLYRALANSFAARIH